MGFLAVNISEQVYLLLSRGRRGMIHSSVCVQKKARVRRK